MVTEEEVDDAINTLVNYIHKTYGTDVVSYCGFSGDEGLFKLTSAARRFLLEKHEITSQESLTSHDFERAKSRLEALVRKGCQLGGFTQHKTKLPSRTYQHKGTYSEPPSNEMEISMPHWINTCRMANELHPIKKETLELKYTIGINPDGTKKIKTKLVPKFLYSQLRTKADEFSRKMKHFKALQEKDKV